MESLTERQQLILSLVVREYTDTATPVSSRALVEKYGLDVSPATVRNDLAALTEMGYLRQPHTSAGREPTEMGYRYFVQRLIGETELPIAEQNTITHQFYQARGDIEQWMRLAASVLAQHGRGASLVTAPRQERARFKHLELISTHGRLVLLVLVLSGGEVRQQMLTLAEPVSQEKLSAIAQRITALCVGKDAEAVLAQVAGASTFEQEVIRLVAEMLRKSEEISAGDVIRDGVANVLAEPEFASSETARQALRVLEERTYLEQLLSKAVSSSVGGVQVVIGGDNAWQELREFSMVLARYGVPGYATGALGVFGPQRMPYGRAISTVRFVAGLMSNLIYEIYFE
ncbi:MAG: heat-inducible transcriptional repressor HrcA [Anaerolineales bacterium]|nr:heat-inducible transcriptional repressor HrcA [Anaerolineales bacterium]